MYLTHKKANFAGVIHRLTVFLLVVKWSLITSIGRQSIPIDYGDILGER
jgi:hypothetical protein